MPDQAVDCLAHEPATVMPAEQPVAKFGRILTGAQTNNAK